jgi:hypothetical protein
MSWGWTSLIALRCPSLATSFTLAAAVDLVSMRHAVMVEVPWTICCTDAAPLFVHDPRRARYGHGADLLGRFPQCLRPIQKLSGHQLNLHLLHQVYILFLADKYRNCESYILMNREDSNPGALAAVWRVHACSPPRLPVDGQPN